MQVGTAACLANAVSLARLPALRTLCCYSTSGLPSVAPHLTQITCLQLGCTNAAELAGEGNRKRGRRRLGSMPGVVGVGEG